MAFRVSDKHIDTMEAARAAFEDFRRAICSASIAAENAVQFFNDQFMTGVIAPKWIKAHPGRRLPGGKSNARLRKKQRDRLWRWWMDSE